MAFEIPQTTFGAPARGLAGDVLKKDDAVTGVTALKGRPKIIEVVFADTWAAADTVATTIGGHVVNTTLAAGEDTVTEARDAVQSDVEEDVDAAQLVTIAAVSTDTVRYTQVEQNPGSGQYLDLPVTCTATTAGDGDVTVNVTQTAQSTEHLNFGQGVALDNTGKNRYTLPAAASFTFGGVIMRQHKHNRGKDEDTWDITGGETFAVLRRGRIRVKVEDAVTRGAQAYLRHTRNGANAPGGWRSDADGSRADLVPCYFEQSGAAGSIVDLWVGTK